MQNQLHEVPHSLPPSFFQAIYLNLLLENKEYNYAKKLLKKAWNERPHPQYTPIIFSIAKHLKIDTLELVKTIINSQFNLEESKLLLVKAEGPNATVGRLGEGIEKIITHDKPDLMIMIDASLKLEGEDSASIARGFGAAMGGIGTDRFQIEDVATKNGIPILAIVIKQSIYEALTLMTKEIADQASSVRTEIHDMIRENTQENQTVMIVGVGNTLGVSQ